MSELIERAKKARQEMIDDDVNGWPNTMQDLIDRIEELEALTERQVRRTGQLTGEVDRYIKCIQELEGRVIVLETIANRLREDILRAR